MGEEKVKRQLRKNGEQAPLKPATDAKTIGPHQTEKPDKIQESSSETLESAQEPRSKSGNLPDSYGETRVVLLPVEPYLLHVYWEVAFAELEKAKHQLGDNHARAQAILRFYDVTNIVFHGTNAHSSFDVHIDPQAKNWYIDLWSPEKSYFVELGLKTEDGQFSSMTRSNIAETPRTWPAPRANEHYMLVAGDYDLVETVPAPIDLEPSHGVTPRMASPAEPELPSAAEIDHHSETPPPFAAQENPSRAEVHEEPFGDDGIEAEGEERPSDAKIVRPNDSAKILRTKLAEYYKFRMERKPHFKPEVPSTQGVHFQYEKGSDFDLTEMSESKFTLGVSSNSVIKYPASSD